MYKIEGTTIYLTRGDSFYAEVEMIDKVTGEEYVPEEGDRVRFALKRRCEDKTALLIKEIPIETQMLHLEPQDTKSLSFGEYVYDIELTTASGDVDTFIWEAKFVLGKEVH